MADGNYRKLKNYILDLFFPPRCPGCAVVININATDAFCPVCRQKWEKHKREICYRCGQPMDNCWCGVRLDNNGYVNSEHHLVQYDKKANTVIKRLLYKMKNYNNGIVFKTIGREMYNELYHRLDYNNLIIAYIPRSKANIKKYGHDQSLILAKELSALTELDIAHVLFHKGGSNQKTLDITKRQKNADKSYHIINGAGKLIKEKNVILIDDVLTTGASATRCARLLKQKGAKRVILFTVAKTI